MLKLRLLDIVSTVYSALGNTNVLEFTVPFTGVHTLSRRYIKPPEVLQVLNLIGSLHMHLEMMLEYSSNNQTAI